MADNLTNTGENLTLNFALGLAPADPVTPMKVALVTVIGNDATAGTEVTGGSYVRKSLTVASAVNGATSNSADLIWTGMPACTVVGVEVWDSAATPTPVRWWWGALGTQRTLLAGDECRFVAGALTFAQT